MAVKTSCLQHGINFCSVWWWMILSLMSDIETPLTISPPPLKKTITAFICYPLVLARFSRVPGDLELVTGVIRPRGSRIVFPKSPVMCSYIGQCHSVSMWMFIGIFGGILCFVSWCWLTRVSSVTWACIFTLGFTGLLALGRYASCISQL